MPIPTTTRQHYFPKFGNITDLTPREVSLAPPKSFEVLVRIHAVSLNYRDLLGAWGKYPQSKPDLVPCSDAAGEIIAIGEDVTGFKEGDRVLANFSLDHLHGDITPEIQGTALGGSIDGVLTEYRTFPGHSLVHIPEHLSYEEASTLPCAAVTAWNALQGPVPLKGGDTVLVQGTGGVSMFALQFAAGLGASVIATSSSDEKLKLAGQLGAQHLINYKTTPDWDKEVWKITDSKGAHHIIEVGGPGTLLKSADAVRYAGWIHNIGFVGGLDSDISNLPLKLLFKGATYRGVLIGSRSQFEDMNRFISVTKLKPVVDKVFPFEEAQDAFRHLESQKHVGKVVIKVTKN